ncbi:MAG: BON domain-containing protein [Rhodanobacteraceae bacterium]|nr:BON domain-containing protein [Rhodanobacteraceae bacterium]
MLAISGIATATAADQKPGGTVSEQVADARRETQILTGFAMNPHLRGLELAVTVDGNKAVLDGNVEDNFAKDLAEQIATGADGVKHVDNRILVDANYVRPKYASSERSFSEKAGDATISASIKSKLLWNSHTDGLDIHVNTHNGKVTLTGSAGSGEEKSLAGRIAMDTEGVLSINNEIALIDKSAKAKAGMPDAQAGKPVSDSWITSKVKSSLLFTRGVDSFDITVTTREGVVSLSGVVNSTAERELAIRVTQDVRGVKKVDVIGLKVG